MHAGSLCQACVDESEDGSFLRAPPCTAWFMPSQTSPRLETTILSAVDLPGIQSHPHDRINSQRVEAVDFLLFGDAASNHQVSSGGALDGVNRLHRNSAHQTFRVDVGIEERLAIRLQLANHVECRERSLRTPPVDRYSSAFRVEGKHQFRSGDR